MTTALMVAPRRRLSAWPLLVPAMGIVATLCLVPLCMMVELSLRSAYSGEFAYTLDHYRDVATSAYLHRQLLSSLALALAVTALCAVAGYPVAYFLARTDPATRNRVFLALTIPLLINVVVRTIGWTIVLGSEGLINRLLLRLGAISSPLELLGGFWAVVVGLVHVLLPFMVISIVGVVQKIDPALEAVARAHGATWRQAFYRIVLPLSAPGIATGCILVFCLSIGAYVTPVWLGRGKVLTVARGIYEQTVVFVDLPAAAATAIAMVAACAIVVAAFSVAGHSVGQRRA